MKLLQDENAQTENVIEVAFVVMGTVLLMTLVVLVLGPFVDAFMDAANNLNIPLAAWGQDMMNILPVRMASLFFAVPVFYVILMMVWGIKTVVKRHQYTTQDQQYMTDEYQ